jgi:hypothetical protein
MMQHYYYCLFYFFWNLTAVSTFTIVSDHRNSHRRHVQHQRTLVIGRPPSQQCRIIGKQHQHQPTSCTQLSAWRLIGKYFQIEEMEDRDACTTEVILNSNATVTTLETNGPLHKEATGTWTLDSLTGEFLMTLQRTYEAGQKSKISTNVGVFRFTTARKFVGRLYNIGIKQGISGNIYDMSDVHDETSIDELRKVGFFEMIDTTLNEDGEVTLRGRTRSS